MSLAVVMFGGNVPDVVKDVVGSNEEVVPNVVASSGTVVSIGVVYGIVVTAVPGGVVCEAVVDSMNVVVAGNVVTVVGSSVVSKDVVDSMTVVSRTLLMLSVVGSKVVSLEVIPSDDVVLAIVV